MLVAIFLTPYTAQSKEVPPTPKCLNDLAWNRWSYTKAHYDVQQTFHQRGSKDNTWSPVYNQRQCLGSLAIAKKLRLGESAHWNRIHLSRAAVKWIVRRQFRSQGREIVLRAWKVVSCESNFRWYANNGSDKGPWQINYVHGESDKLMFSPELSTAWAWRASKKGHDFSPTWTCASIYGIP